jgi:hypothetical protein
VFGRKGGKEEGWAGGRMVELEEGRVNERDAKYRRVGRWGENR